MGLISDKSIQIYGTGKDQIDVAKENRLRNPNGSHTLLGVLLSQGLPSLTYGVCNMIEQSASKETDSAPKTDPVQTTLDSYNTPEAIAVKTAIKSKNKEQVKTALQTFHNKYQTYAPFETVARTCGLMK